MTSSSYLSSIYLLKKTYFYKNNIKLILGLWGESDFQPLLVIKENGEEIVRFTYEDWLTIAKLLYRNSEDLFNFIFVSKGCCFQNVTNIRESVHHFFDCINLHMNKYKHMEDEIKVCISYFKSIIRNHCNNMSIEKVRTLLLKSCLNKSLLEYEMLTVGYEYFYPEIILFNI